MSDHYFSPAPHSAEKRQLVGATVWGHSLRLESASGVFSAGRLDTGTAVLLREAPPPTGAGTLLDLGCGYGVIACALAVQAQEAHVWAVDTNDRARRLCGDNAVTAGVTARVHVAEPDGVPPEMCFDEIWSNPPIRIGKPALHDLLLRWLPRLTPNGRALLVVGKNLGADSLQRWLDDQAFPCARLASAKGFRVLQVVRS
ncbi:MAG: class I SAM-dependent methyltransferase [Nocardioidaceae bacterium]